MINSILIFKLVRTKLKNVPTPLSEGAISNQHSCVLFTSEFFHQLHRNLIMIYKLLDAVPQIIRMAIIAMKHMMEQQIVVVMDGHIVQSFPLGLFMNWKRKGQ